MALCGARFARKAVYDTLDAVLEMFLPKVQQQSKFAVAQAKLSEELLAMNSGQLFDGLQLYDALSSTRRSARKPSSKTSSS